MILLAVPALFLLQIGIQTLVFRITPALAVTVSFALMAWGLRAVSRSGALAGAAVTFIVFLAMGMQGFLLVLLVFILTYISTHFGHAQKERLGLLQVDGRTAAQVFANIAAVAMTCGPVLFFPNSRSVLFTGACAALAEAAADTVSSEVGQAFRMPTYMITNFSRVPAGQNGGISVAGTVSGILAALIVALAAAWMRLVRVEWLWIVVLAGCGGMLFDSLLGATLERPGRLGNNSVNFVSTVLAAFFGVLIAYLLW